MACVPRPRSDTVPRISTPEYESASVTVPTRRPLASCSVAVAMPNDVGVAGLVAGADGEGLGGNCTDGCGDEHASTAPAQATTRDFIGLYTRASQVNDSVSVAAASRTRARASSAVSPIADRWPILRPARAPGLP